MWAHRLHLENGLQRGMLCGWERDYLRRLRAGGDIGSPGVGSRLPRSLWMKTQGWKFKDPEANEPSDTMYSLTRVGSAIGICAMLCLICTLAGAGAGG